MNEHSSDLDVAKITDRPNGFLKRMRQVVAATSYILTTVALVADYGFGIMAKSPGLSLYVLGYAFATGNLVPVWELFRQYRAGPRG